MESASRSVSPELTRLRTGRKFSTACRTGRVNPYSGQVAREKKATSKTVVQRQRRPLRRRPTNHRDGVRRRSAREEDAGKKWPAKKTRAKQAAAKKAHAKKAAANLDAKDVNETARECGGFRCSVDQSANGREGARMVAYAKPSSVRYCEPS